MAAGKIASWALSEQFLPESTLCGGSNAIGEARARGSELGVTPVLAGAGSTLRSVAALLCARAVVEVGTGSGVGSLYLLDAMPADGVLTTIDSEPENHRVARDVFTRAGVGHARVRTIGGHGPEVLSRLTPGAYDMVVFNGDHPACAQLVDAAVRVLRHGGALVILNVMFHDRVGDPAHQDPTTVRIRGVLEALSTDERFVSSLSPAGDGVLTAVLR